LGVSEVLEMVEEKITNSKGETVKRKVEKKIKYYPDKIFALSDIQHRKFLSGDPIWANDEFYIKRCDIFDKFIGSLIEINSTLPISRWWSEIRTLNI
jgi:hypothetical protein